MSTVGGDESRTSSLFLRDDPIIEEEAIEFTHRQYIDSLEEIITSSEAPWNVGLFGQWGTGKSTVIRILQKRVNQRRDGTYFLTFDTWKHAEGSIRTQLLLEVNKQLGEIEAELQGPSSSRWRRILSRLKNYQGSDLSWHQPVREEDIIGRLYDSRQRLRSPDTTILSKIIRYLYIHPLSLASLVVSATLIFLWAIGYISLQITALVILAQIAVSVLVGLDQSTHTMEKRIDSPRKDWSGAYEQIFNEIIDESNCEEVVIAIDNLDRCDSQTVYTVLVSLKTFMETPRCKYIVVCDDDALRSHIEAIDTGEYFGDFDTAQEFIRKFFQAYIGLPPLIEANIREYAHEQNTRIEEPHADSAIEVMLQAQTLTPRRIKHLINRLTTQRRVGRRLEESQDVVVGQFTSETGQTLLMKMIVLQEEFPIFYQALREQPELLRAAEQATLSSNSAFIKEETISRIYESRDQLDPERLDYLESFLAETADVEGGELRSYRLRPHIFFNQPEYAVELGGTEALEAALENPESSVERIKFELEEVIAEAGDRAPEQCSEAIFDQIRTEQRHGTPSTIAIITKNLATVSSELDDEQISVIRILAEKLYQFKKVTLRDPFTETDEEDTFELFRHHEGEAFWSDWLSKILNQHDPVDTDVDEILDIITNWEHIPDEIRTSFTDTITEQIEPYGPSNPELQYFDWLLAYLGLINDVHPSGELLTVGMTTAGSSYLPSVGEDNQRGFINQIGEYYRGDVPRETIGLTLNGLMDGIALDSADDLRLVETAFDSLGIGYEHLDLDIVIDLINQLPPYAASISVITHVLRRDRPDPPGIDRRPFRTIESTLERLALDGDNDVVVALTSPIDPLEYRLTQFEGVRRALISQYPDGSLTASELHEAIPYDMTTVNLLSSRVKDLLNSRENLDRVAGARLYHSWQQSSRPEFDELGSLDSLISIGDDITNVREEAVLAILVDHFNELDSRHQFNVMESIVDLSRHSHSDTVVSLWKRIVPMVSSGELANRGQSITDYISDELQSEPDTEIIHNLLLIVQHTYGHAKNFDVTSTLNATVDYLSSDTAGQRDYDLLLPIVTDLVELIDSPPSAVFDFLAEIKRGSVCPACGSNQIMQSSELGERYCEECGYILEEPQADPMPEWRRRTASANDQSETRLHSSDLTTTIDWRDTDAYGQSISSKKRSKMYRLRKWQERIRTFDAVEHNHQFALSEIDRMGSALGVPSSVREVASVIYRRALKEDLILGRSIEGVATSALYAACRKEGIPHSLKDISEVSRVERKEISRTYRYISQELGLEMKPVDPKKYVPGYCSDLGLSNKVQAKANEIIEITAKRGLLSGKSPTGYAAAAVYVASLLCDEMKTQREVAEVAQVSEVTVRNRYQEQIEAMDLQQETD